MTDEEKERFYDDEIAPVLLELGRKCKTAGIPFMAVAEWNKGLIGATRMLVSEMSWPMQMIFLAGESNGNVDTLMFACAKRARRIGHSSVVLHLMGVPEQPKQPEQTSEAP